MRSWLNCGNGCRPGQGSVSRAKRRLIASRSLVCNFSYLRGDRINLIFRPLPIVMPELTHSESRPSTLRKSRIAGRSTGLSQPMQNNLAIPHSQFQKMTDTLLQPSETLAATRHSPESLWNSDETFPKDKKPVGYKIKSGACCNAKDC